MKLWQFDADDRMQMAGDMGAAPLDAVPDLPGVSMAELFSDHRETVHVEEWASGAPIARDLPGGAEVLLLDGTCTESGQAMRKQSWLRIPVGGRLDAVAGPDGARIWIKTGGLRFVEPPSG